MSTLPFTSAVVTGASSGIGESLVRVLAAAGVPTVVVARRRDRLEELASELPGIDVLAADLTDPADLQRVAARVASADEPVDLVVNNAGFGTSGWFHELDPDRLDREIELNVGALTRLSHAALAQMVPRRRGWLLNVSSVASFQPAPKLAVYAATKAYVTNLSEALHEEVRPHGVQVCALCPGLTRTEFQSVSNTDAYQQQFPAFAWCTPDEVARAGLDDLVRGKALSVPGAMYKGLVLASQVTPNAVARRLGGVMMRRR